MTHASIHLLVQGYYYLEPRGGKQLRDADQLTVIILSNVAVNLGCTEGKKNFLKDLRLFYENSR